MVVTAPGSTNVRIAVECAVVVDLVSFVWMTVDVTVRVAVAVAVVVTGRISVVVAVAVSVAVVVSVEMTVAVSVTLAVSVTVAVSVVVLVAVSVTVTSAGIAALAWLGVGTSRTMAAGPAAKITETPTAGRTLRTSMSTSLSEPQRGRNKV
jgi:hypothetical protein